jgi:pantothenate kinase
MSTGSGDRIHAGELDGLVARILAMAATEERRLVVAIAGPPGSGKSTFAERLRAALDTTFGRRCAAVVPMDGFHLDNAILDARGLRSRKGAPETFDSAGFVALVRRLRTEDEVVAPRFDRKRDLAVAGASVIEAENRVVLLEGNYLLLRRQPWDALEALVDLEIWLDVPLEVLEARLVQRWLDHGHAPEAARERAHTNDIPNALLAIRESRPADVAVIGR